MAQDVDAIGRSDLEIAMVGGEPAVDHFEDVDGVVAQPEPRRRFLSPIAGMALNRDPKRLAELRRDIHAPVSQISGRGSVPNGMRPQLARSSPSSRRPAPFPGVEHTDRPAQQRRQRDRLADDGAAARLLRAVDVDRCTCPSPSEWRHDGLRIASVRGDGSRTRRLVRRNVMTARRTSKKKLTLHFRRV